MKAPWEVPPCGDNQNKRQMDKILSTRIVTSSELCCSTSYVPTMSTLIPESIKHLMTPKWAIPL